MACKTSSIPGFAFGELVNIYDGSSSFFMILCEFVTSCIRRFRDNLKLEPKGQCFLSPISSLSKVILEKGDPFPGFVFIRNASMLIMLGLRVSSDSNCSK